MSDQLLRAEDRAAMDGSKTEDVVAATAAADAKNNTTSTTKQEQQLDPEWVHANALRLDAAAEKAYRLIEDFSSKYETSSSSTDNNNPWRNPYKMYSQLEQVRDELNEAWKEQPKMQQQAPDSSSNLLSPDDFRAFYIDLVTDAFADSLQAMQESGDEINLDVLADCLQSGMDLYDDRDRELLYQEFGESTPDADEGMAETMTMTQHEKHQMDLGITALQQ
eukprot:CAMPEP_0119560822 /NCGR_PEP_ID=MMETSP1352-20130426/15970_1 /TAXON_ID=265584 /ORGANISM="Stauroneis constricta, Strain CCMP1120" /LENGTH=220 /DNA_ID=CAMNT_0007608883 /DNA_START=48 /DNA_END=707 /DNA_ORIENTATION=+